ncbi:MAG: HlyD family secretion protein [Verrucomicrobiota bacterium]
MICLFRDAHANHDAGNKDFMSEQDKPAPPDENPASKVSRVLPNSPRKWVIAIVCILVVVVVYVALLDRFTPMTTESYVQAFVTQVAPQVSGNVTAVHVHENQLVQKGDLLFELDARPYQYAVDLLKAELILARKDVRLLEKDLEDATQLLASAQASLDLRQKEFEEFSQAAATQAIAQRDFFEAEARLRENEASTRKAEVDQAKAVENLNALVGDENALIARAAASLRQAEYNLSQTKIFASADGFVSNVQLTKGTYVDSGTPVMTVIDADNWWIVATFPENSLPRLKPQMPTQVAFGMLPGKLFPASVESIGWGVAQGQGVPSGMLLDVEEPTDWMKNTQRFPVRIRLENPDALENLRVGATATVLVYSSENPFLNALGWFWLRIASLLNFLS